MGFPNNQPLVGFPGDATKVEYEQQIDDIRLQNANPGKVGRGAIPGSRIPEYPVSASHVTLYALSHSPGVGSGFEGTGAPKVSLVDEQAYLTKALAEAAKDRASGRAQVPDVWVQDIVARGFKRARLIADNSANLPEFATKRKTLQGVYELGILSGYVDNGGFTPVNRVTPIRDCNGVFPTQAGDVCLHPDPRLPGVKMRVEGPPGLPPVNNTRSHTPCPPGYAPDPKGSGACIAMTDDIWKLYNGLQNPNTPIGGPIVDPNSPPPPPGVIAPPGTDPSGPLTNPTPTPTGGPSLGGTDKNNPPGFTGVPTDLNGNPLGQPGGGLSPLGTPIGPVVPPAGLGAPTPAPLGMDPFPGDIGGGVPTPASPMMLGVGILVLLVVLYLATRKGS